MGKDEIAKVNNSTQKDIPLDLKPKERKLMQLIMETGYTKTLTWYAKQMGLSIPMIYKYLQKPNIKDAINRLLDETVWALRPLAYEKLKEAVNAGNVSAIKLVFQLRGELIEHRAVEVKGAGLLGVFDATEYLDLLAEVARLKKLEGKDESLQ